MEKEQVNVLVITGYFEFEEIEDGTQMHGKIIIKGGTSLNVVETTEDVCPN